MFYSLFCCLFLTTNTLYYLELGGCLVHFILFYVLECKDIPNYKKKKLESKLRAKGMASKVLKKINVKQKFLYHRSKYPIPACKNLL